MRNSNGTNKVMSPLQRMSDPRAAEKACFIPYRNIAVSRLAASTAVSRGPK